MYEFSQDAGNYYLITEYCAGGELLSKMLALKRLSEYTVARIVKQVLSAVAYCHAKRVVHRDLKLENVALENDDINGNIKVIDFGTSSIVRRKESMTEFIGSVMADVIVAELCGA